MDRSHIVFLKIAETGNLTVAAKELNVAQPNLTRTVNKLEYEFGTPLFKRMPRGMELTSAGEALRRHLTAISAVYQRARQDIKTIREGYVDVVRIGAGLIYQLLVMPSVMERMFKQYPKTSFHLATGSTGPHIKSLLGGNLDIVLSAVAPKVLEPGLTTTRLGSVNYGVAHRPGTLPNISDDREMPLSELENHSWVIFETEPESRFDLNERFFKLGLPTPRVALTTTSLQLGLEMIKSQGLIMRVPTILKQHLKKERLLVHRTTKPLLLHESGITIHSTNIDHPVLQTLTEEIQKFTQNMPDFSDSN